MTIKIILVDDHAIFREALKALLDRYPGCEVVAETGEEEAVYQLAQCYAPCVMCMDIGLPKSNGVLITKKLLERFPSVKVIALSTHCDRLYIRDMLTAGASGFVSKEDGGSELIKAIFEVVDNKTYLSSSAQQYVTKLGLFEHRSLAPREIEVLRLVAGGFSSSQIAAQLSISSGTVDVHRRNMMRKLGVHSAVELTKYAIQHQLI